MGGGRGKLIKDEHRIVAVELIIEANDAGARLFKACEVRRLERKHPLVRQHYPSFDKPMLEEFSRNFLEK